MIFAVGRMVQLAMQATIELMGKGVSAGVADARFIKPMDERLLTEQAAKAKLVVTVEENVLAGGFGEGVLDALSRAGIETPTLCLGVPDRFIEPRQRPRAAGGVWIDAAEDHRLHIEAAG